MTMALPAPFEDAAAHPHDLHAGVPDRLPAAVVRRLSQLDPKRAIGALAAEWGMIAAAIALAEAAGWWVYPLAVVFIGARQHALTVLGHDAAHGRFLPSRGWNDVIGDVFAQWPMFAGVGAFRRVHGEHHKHLNTPRDANRILWRTHLRDGTVAPEWRYPKTPLGLAAKIARRGAFVTGLWWMVRGYAAQVIFRASWAEVAGRLLWTAAVGIALTLAGAWEGFLLYWVVPYCTWHIAIQYVRLVCEHSNIRVSDPAYADSRTTRARAWERWLVLPRNIHYHIEHHWYPSVPFYNLPALHEELMRQPRFRARACVTDSLVASLKQVVAA